jgi:hypothetical protein
MKKVGKFIGTWFPNWRTMNQKYTEGTKYNQESQIAKDPYAYTGKVVPGTIKVVL